MNFESLSVSLDRGVATVEFSRPEKANALDGTSWKELPVCFRELSRNPACRVVVLSGQGKHFCAGIDLGYLMGVGQITQNDCEGRRREDMREFILDLQIAINEIEKCKKPVIAAVHGGCIGAGVDIISACDMRFSVEDAYFQVKEIDIGMVADLGTLQRLPRIIADGIAREMCYTARKVSGREAAGFGLVNKAFASREEMMEEVIAVAANIASKSPLSIRGTKEMLLYTRDHSIEDGLNYIATWNAAMLLSEDLAKAMQAAMTRQTPEFKD
ncbi:MAG: crotonase/enoyl-CoA hydratase family protein [Bacteroidia bacterium]|nr:crotonase/enoyl-CoA hydratase family protein [Bacteroidia bacterium]